MHRHGHPILGALSGFLFGLSPSLALVVFGVLDLGSPVVGILPIALLLLGIVWALRAPLGRGRPTASA
jgi:hypothetical protein